MTVSSLLRRAPLAPCGRWQSTKPPLLKPCWIAGIFSRQFVWNVALAQRASRIRSRWPPSGGLPLADLNGAHHSFSSAASFIIAGFLPRYWFVFTKTACSSSTERHYIHWVLTSHDEDAFAGVTGRGSRCRAGRHFRVRALSRLITSGDYRARCVPESSRSSACRWCSKLCSERVNTRQIGIGRDRIAIGRFLSGNRNIGRDSRERDRTLIGLANRRLQPLGHLTANAK